MNPEHPSLPKGNLLNACLKYSLLLSYCKQVSLKNAFPNESEKLIQEKKPKKQAVYRREKEAIK